MLLMDSILFPPFLQWTSGEISKVKFILKMLKYHAKSYSFIFLEPFRNVALSFYIILMNYPFGLYVLSFINLFVLRGFMPSHDGLPGTHHAYFFRQNTECDVSSNR